MVLLKQAFTFRRICDEKWVQVNNPNQQAVNCPVKRVNFRNESRLLLRLGEIRRIDVLVQPEIFI